MADPGYDAELVKLLDLLLDPELVPDPSLPMDDAFPIHRFVRFDRNPDEQDRVLALHADGRWRTLTQPAEYPSGDDGLPFDLDRGCSIEGRLVDLPHGSVVRRLLKALAFVGAFEIWGSYHAGMDFYGEPDPYHCDLVDGCFRFRALTDLYMQHIIDEMLPFVEEAEAAPPGVLRVHGAVALELARRSGFPLKMRNKDEVIVDCSLDEAGFLLRRMAAAKNEAEVRYWLAHGEVDIFLDLHPAQTSDGG